MTTTEEYTPPTSASIAETQNTRRALRLLVAQRNMHSKAKRWSTISTVGVAVIAVAAPIISILMPELAIVASAVAGLWIFLGRTLFVNMQLNRTCKAASIQEDFDVLVFGMPALSPKSPRATLEEVEVLAGPDNKLEEKVARQKLREWYPIDTTIPGVESVAIAQRANASYSSRLLNLNSNLWIISLSAWGAISIGIGIAREWELETFLLGVFLPFLPALLDVFEQWKLTKSASRERLELVSSIEEKLLNTDEGHVQPQDLLVWQERMYSLRVSSPQTADFLYRITRKANERAMKGAARELAANSKAQQKGNRQHGR